MANQARLVKCVQLLYGHCRKANLPWDYPNVETRTDNGRFLTHDILTAVGLIQPSTNEGDDEEDFHDSPETLLKKMEAKEVRDRKGQETIMQDANTTSMYDATMQTPCASMSKMSSLGSIQYSGHYPTLEKLHVPGLPPYSHKPGGLQYQLIPGGQVPPTPTESPSKEGRAHDPFSQTQHTMHMMNRMTVLPQADLFSGLPGVIDLDS